MFAIEYVTTGDSVWRRAPGHRQLPHLMAALWLAFHDLSSAPDITAVRIVPAATPAGQTYELS